MAQVLLVEDDDAIAAPLERALRRQQHEVRRTASGEQGLALAQTGDYDVVLLDLDLPDLDGLEVCRRLRLAGSQVGILMLTARGDELDRVGGFDAGADDYLPKPFSVAELSARVRALARRVGPLPTPGAGGFRLDTGARRAYVGAEELTLSVKEFDLLVALHSHQAQVVTREQLMKQVWDENWFGSTKTLDVTIARLRTKLSEAGAPVQITTSRGVGFRLEPDAGDA
jgi:DNA-binding response OmpR family regulator